MKPFNTRFFKATNFWQFFWRGQIPIATGLITFIAQNSTFNYFFFIDSPSTLSYEDTYNTLKYANRAKNIKSNLTSNTISVDFHVTQYAKIVEDLKNQVP